MSSISGAIQTVCVDRETGADERRYICHSEKTGALSVEYFSGWEKDTVCLTARVQSNRGVGDQIVLCAIENIVIGHIIECQIVSANNGG